MRYFVELSYNGKAYHGWQVQPDVISVQQEIEQALYTILRVKTPIVGCGRTDTGVHALHYIMHFDSEVVLDITLVTYKLNALLPKDIAISKMYLVKPEVHARFGATSRSYVYRLSPVKNVFNYNQAYYFKPKLNLEAMNLAASYIVGFKDFECFSKVNTDVKTFNCDVREAQWTVVGTELHFNITADRFLRNMVRAIVGTLINVGLGKITPEDVKTIIASKNRGKAGYSVPGHALYLKDIIYPEDIKLNE